MALWKRSARSEALSAFAGFCLLCLDPRLPSGPLKVTTSRRQSYFFILWTVKGDFPRYLPRSSKTIAGLRRSGVEAAHGFRSITRQNVIRPSRIASQSQTKAVVQRRVVCLLWQFLLAKNWVDETHRNPFPAKILLTCQPAPQEFSGSTLINKMLSSRSYVFKRKRWTWQEYF